MERDNENTGRIRASKKPDAKASEEFHQMPYAIRKRTKKEGESDGKKR